MTPEPVITEDPNDDPPAQDDGLGATPAEPFDPADVDENDTRTPEDI